MSFLKGLFRTKPLDAHPLRDACLRRYLTAFDLILLGIGAIIGAGIFVLTGLAAATIGAAVPEPTSFMLVVCGAAFGVLHRHRRS